MGQDRQQQNEDHDAQTQHRGHVARQFPKIAFTPLISRGSAGQHQVDQDVTTA